MLYLLILLGLFCDLAFSVDFSKVFAMDPNNAVAKYDISLHYLGQIFGPIFDSGSHVDTSLVSQYMRWFNYGVVSFVGGVVATTIATSAVNSSREGVFMGRMLPTAWYPLRVVLGAGMLAPTVNGYSGIQILILWSAMQGVGLANTMWGIATDYVNVHGGAFQDNVLMVQSSASQENAGDYKNILILGSNILRMQNCIAFNKRSYNSYVKNNPGINYGLAPGYKWVRDDKGFYTYIEATTPARQSKSAYLNCGSIIVPTSTPVKCDLSDSKKCDSLNLVYNNDLYLSFMSFYNQLELLSDSMLKSCIRTGNCDLLRSLSNSNSLKCEYNKQNSTDLLPAFDGCQGIEDLSSASNIYYNSILQAARSYALQAQNPRKDSFVFGSGGWAKAGQFYSQLASLQEDLSPEKLILANFQSNLPKYNGFVPINYQSIQDAFISAEYLDNYFSQAPHNGWLPLSSAALMQSSLNRIPESNNSSSGLFGTAAELVVRDKLYLAMAALMPKRCVDDNSTNNQSLGACSNYTPTQELINQLKSEDASQRAQGRATFQSQNNEAITSQIMSADRSATPWSCSLPIIGGGFNGCDYITTSSGIHNASAEDIVLSSASILIMLGTQSYILAAGLVGAIVTDAAAGTNFYGAYNSIMKDLFAFQSNNEARDLNDRIIGTDIQVYVYQMGQAWLDSFTNINENENAHLNVNVIDNIAKFGAHIVQANLNFLFMLMQDIYWLQRHAAYYFLNREVTFQLYAMLSQGVTDLLVGIASDLSEEAQANILLYIPAWLFGLLTGIAVSGLLALQQYHKSVAASQRIYASEFRWRAFFYVPIATAVTVPMILLGLLLWVFLPLLPFLVFLFTVVGWMVSLIEAVLAGPLIAAGITHPQGHELLGRAEQSLMLIVSVVIRPALILLSFIIAIALTYVAVWVSSQLMMQLLAEFMTKLADSNSYLGTYIAMIFLCYLYVRILFKIINECFSIVYELPAKIMRWIGTPREDSIGPSIYAIQGEITQMFGRVSSSGKDTIQSSRRGDSALML